MKIAVISDIHGNLLALQAVLEDIKQNGIEKIYILGDLAFCGSEPNETIEFIRENLSEQVSIQGNTDLMILKATGDEDDSYMPKSNTMASALIYAQEVLTDDNKDYLASLPESHSEAFGPLKVLFVHGSPRRNDEGITPDIKYSKLDEMLADVEENMVFCGHTHIPIIHQSKGKTVVNTGSVGRPFGENPRAVYAILDLTNVEQRQFDIEHRYVKYDLNQAVEKLEACDFEGAETLAYMLNRATDKIPTKAELN
ncbi:MAG: metallophosphoesterase [Vampirovibrionia bacterium]